MYLKIWSVIWNSECTYGPPSLTGAKENFANKLDLLKRSRFLPKNVLLKFYFSVILPSVKYDISLVAPFVSSLIPMIIPAPF